MKVYLFRIAEGQYACLFARSAEDPTCLTPKDHYPRPSNDDPYIDEDPPPSTERYDP